jgi:pseudouridine synthase
MLKIPLQKFIADAGYCSRKQAEEMLKKSVEGNRHLVLVNGISVGPGIRVDENDDVRVDGKKLELPKQKIYIKLNKPAGYTCTTREFKNEKNVLILLQDGGEGSKLLSKHRLLIVGRLDKNSRGLIILTSDGDLGQRLTHPKFKHRKTYEVKIKQKDYDPKEVENRFTQGVDIGEEAGIVRAEKTSHLGNKRFEVVLTQGKKRQIRRMFNTLGLTVTDLVRVGVDELRLGDLKEGEWRHLTQEEIEKLKNN